MANPAGHVVLGEEEVQQSAERYAKMEAELQALRQQNEELARTVQEQQEMVATERVRVDRRARAQTQEFADLTAELLAGRQGPHVQFQGMHIGVKVEKPETYSGKRAIRGDLCSVHCCRTRASPVRRAAEVRNPWSWVWPGKEH